MMQHGIKSGIPPRQDRRIAERIHDPYMTRLKLPDPCVCPECGVLFHNGRWEWPAGAPPAGAEEHTCPACLRVRDRYPAGWVTIKGAFAEQHHDELLHLVRHQEQAEKGEHPMNRIMDIGKEDGDMVITTTDIHLPRRIGEALQRAYDGELDYHYEEGNYMIRVHWRRDA